MDSCAAWMATSTSSPSLRIVCRMKSRRRAWCRSATFIRALRAPRAMPPRPANKLIDLKLEGAETELDNNIIQQIADPLLHLVRNSVAHGIERAEERYRVGQVRSWQCGCSCLPSRQPHIHRSRRRRPRYRLRKSSRTRLSILGCCPLSKRRRLHDRDLLELLFHPGFSTAPRKTELAGRGVGLDVVRANLSALNGEIEIDTQKGAGHALHAESPAHADHLAGVVRALRRSAVRIPAVVRGRDPPLAPRTTSKKLATSCSQKFATKSQRSFVSIANWACRRSSQSMASIGW